MKTIYITKESQEIERLSEIISEINPTIGVLGTTSKEECIKSISTYRPDVLFIDLSSKDLEGFNPSSIFHDMRFMIIYMSDYDAHVYKAFQLNAIDFILKPLGYKEINQALSKVKNKDLPEELLQKVATLFELQSKDMNDKIKVRTSNGYTLLEPKDILRVEAERAYSVIHTTNGVKFICSKNLKEYEEKLSHHGFFRVHTSHLVNLEYVAQVITNDGFIANTNIKYINKTI